jgi:hypothetical protein
LRLRLGRTYAVSPTFDSRDPAHPLSGGVAGLILAPRLAQACGLRAAFVWAGLAGAAWAAGAGAVLAAAGLGGVPRAARPGGAAAAPAGASGGGDTGQGAAGSFAAGKEDGRQAAQRPAGPTPAAEGVSFLGMRLTRRGARQVAVLCAAHATIGYGFFLMQVI